MKLTKQKLITLIKKDLEILEYKFVIDSVTGAQGLYIKKLADSLFLTLGLTIHRYYDSLFTGSFYLSKTTGWSATWGDIPMGAYQRIGHFLTQEEREQLLEEEYSKPSMNDAWWNIGNDTSIKNFFETVAIAERHLLDRSDLFDAVKKSREANKMAVRASKVIAAVRENNFDDQAFLFAPLKPVDNIPAEWFYAAEKIIKDYGDILNANTVKWLAADAYRQSLFL